MNILIIEDEPRAANQLQTMLRSCSFDYQLLDIIDSVEEAISWFQKHSAPGTAVPELVFMDIQLADGLSFEIFQKIEVKSPIIFTTAFDQYAIQAFKVNSVDYLLKPIQKDELNAALDKFLSSNSSPIVQPDILKQLLTSFQTPKKRSGILVKSGGGFMQIKVSDFLYFYSEESITFGVTTNNRYIIEETVDQLFDSLSPE
jgi:DNA-binding LytR/AlgR family response regulator